MRKCLVEVGISDEMNLHVMQSPEAIEELKRIMYAGRNIVSAQSQGPCNGLVQDSLVAYYKLTNTWRDTGKGTMVSRHVFEYLLGEMFSNMSDVISFMQRLSRYYPKYVGIDRGDDDDDTGLNVRYYCKTAMVPGKMVASMIFPATLSYEQVTNVHPDYPKVMIRRGIVLPRSGPLCKKTIGIKNNSITHYIWKYYSIKDAQHFLSVAKRLCYKWLITEGFSISLSDCILTDTTLATKELNNMDAKANIIGGDLRAGHIDENDAEVKIGSVVGSTMNLSLTMVQEHANKGDRNTFSICATSGAKGTPINLIQTQCYLGQQSINGNRVPLSTCRERRTLPCYEVDTNTLESRGFVYNNYVTGLNPQETFFHAMGGRKGMIATSINTSTTGYIQKRMSRKMEDLVTRIDGSVRDCNGNIIQFLYGGDGMDPRHLVSDFRESLFANISHLSAIVENACMGWSAKHCRFGTICAGHEKVAFSDEMIDEILELFMVGYPGIKNACVSSATSALHCVLADRLRSIRLCKQRHMDFVMKLKILFDQTRIAEGTPVGLIAAASLGEPSMQMTLNSFHLSGYKGADISSGIPRFSELLHVTSTKDQKHPMIRVYLDDPKLQRMVHAVRLDYQLGDSDRAYQRKIDIVAYIRSMCHFEETAFNVYLSSMTMYRLDETIESSAIGLVTYPVHDPEWWVHAYLAHTHQELPVYAWMIQCRLDLGALYKRETTLSLAARLTEVSGDLFTVIPSPTVFGLLNIYVHRLGESMVSRIDGNGACVTPSNLDYYVTRDVIMPMLGEVSMGGIRHIHKVYPVEDPFTHEWYLQVPHEHITTLRSIQMMYKLLMIPIVDVQRTFTSDVHTIQAIYGIDAAKKFYVNEFCRILGIEDDHQDRRHVVLLVNAMTISGTFTAVSRNGIQPDNQPLSRVMFECSTDNAVLAAYRNEVDDAKSFASSVILGKISATIGTGTVKIRDEPPINIERIDARKSEIIVHDI